MSRRPDLRAVKRAVEAAVAEANAPLAPGEESRRLTFAQDHLTRSDWRLVEDVVRYLRREHLKVYKRFLYWFTVADIVVEYFVAGGEPTVSGLLRELGKRAREKSWLIEMPIANLEPPAETVPLGPGAMLVRTSPERDRERMRFGPYLKDVWAVKRHLGDEFSVRARWLNSAGFITSDLDTRNAAALLLAETGTAKLAVSLAETRARLALAMWCLLAPPRVSVARRSRPVWPTVASWTPQPWIHFDAPRKPYRPDPHRFDHARRSGNTIFEYGMYRLTRNPAFLVAPFDAIEKARSGNDCALSLLSAARSLYLAERIPIDLERTERVVYVWRALEALCAPGWKGAPSTSDERWSGLVRNLRLRRELYQRGYSGTEIDDAFQLVETLRHLTMHFARDVLVNLNYPAQRKTSLQGARVLDSDSASLAVVADDWPVVLIIVRAAARRLTKGAIRNGWDERWFHSKFA